MTVSERRGSMGRMGYGRGAGEFVAKEVRHFKKKGKRNKKQAIAIGLSKARKAGVEVPAK